MTEQKNPITVILQATSDPIEKDGHHQQAGYRYSTPDAIYSAARKALAKVGLAVWINEIESELTDLPFGKQGATIKGLRVKYEIGLTDQLTNHVPPDNCETMTIYTRINSTQASVGARTSVIKKFLVDKFLLVAGTPDLESQPSFEPGFETEKAATNSQSDRLLNQVKNQLSEETPF